MHTLHFVPLLAIVFAACGAPEPPPVVKCTTPTGPGTTHAGETISTVTTWTAAGSPHLITSTPRVTASGTLRIEPCAEVRIQGGYGIGVEGRLEALGTADQPIVITAQDGSKPFGYLEVWGGFADLSYVTLSNGGATGPNSNAMLDVWGASTPQRTQNARLRHVAITGSQQFGLTLERSGTLTDDSTDVVISGAKLGPIMVRGAQLAGGIPPGTYTGNTVNDILVIASSPMSEDTTWPSRGVPYRIGDANRNGSDFVVGPSVGGGLVTWTVAAGVTIRVTPAGRIFFQNSGTSITGSLIARGTAADPIVFTSAADAPAPGDWRGLVFKAGNAASTALDSVQIRYAGGPSQANGFHCQPGSAGAYSVDEDAALAIFGQPTSAFLTNSVIADSAADGVDLAYSGGSVDFLATNTFTNVARCRQTLPRSSNGSCPTPVPACP